MIHRDPLTKKKKKSKLITKLHRDPSITHHKTIGTNHNHQTQIHF